MNSEKFLSGLAFHVEVGGELNEKTVPNILNKIEKVENPNMAIGEIKGLLETMQSTGYSPRTTEFASSKINEIMEREGAKEEPDTPQYGTRC